MYRLVVPSVELRLNNIALLCWRRELGVQSWRSFVWAAAGTSITIFHQIATQRRTIIVPAKTKGGREREERGIGAGGARKSSKGRRKVIKMDE